MDPTKSDGTPQPRARRFALPGISDLPSSRLRFTWHLAAVRLPPTPGAYRAKEPRASDRPSDAGRPQVHAPEGGA
jgi:hypothetical protein